MIRFPVLVAALALTAPAAGAPLTVAAYYYGWYEESRWEQGHARAPALGRYDSRDPAVVAQQFRWAQRYGVDVFIGSWWGPGGLDDVTLRDHLLPSPARGPTRIALLYESHARLGLTDNRIVFGERERATLLSDFDYLAETYFRHPGYYRIGGRPVVVLYVSRIFRGELEAAIRELREHVLARHGLRLFLIGDEVDWDLGPDPARIALYDAITGYTLYSRTQPQFGFLGLVADRYRAFRRAGARLGVPIVPGILPRFDDTAFRPDENHYVLSEPGLFRRSLTLAGRYVDSRAPLLTVTSWNEWHEDTQIEPGAGYGFQALRELARFKAAYLRR